jgi:hypothetical protein
MSDPESHMDDECPTCHVPRGPGEVDALYARLEALAPALWCATCGEPGVPNTGDYVWCKRGHVIARIRALATPTSKERG